MTATSHILYIFRFILEPTMNEPFQDLYSKRVFVFAFAAHTIDRVIVVVHNSRYTMQLVRKSRKVRWCYFEKI